MSRKKLVGREVRCSGIEAQDPPGIEYNILILIDKSTFVTYSVLDDKIGAESVLLSKLDSLI